jgi:hypothetical protein
MKEHEMSYEKSKSKAGSGATRAMDGQRSQSKRTRKQPDAQFLFDALPEYLQYIAERGATEVFMTAMTNPNIHGFAPRDPRADVFHVILSARDAEGFISTFVNATELTATDNLARRTEFPALIDKELAPYIAAIKGVGLKVRRGRVLPGKTEKRPRSVADSEEA